jgi:hypothetical protein
LDKPLGQAATAVVERPRRRVVVSLGLEAGASPRALATRTAHKKANAANKQNNQFQVNQKKTKEKYTCTLTNTSPLLANSP